MEKKEITKNPGFLQAVICMLAEERYKEEIIDSGFEDEIGPGEQWDSKEEWMNDTISGWFNETAKKVKLFPEEPDLEVKKLSIELAQSIYKLPLGEKLNIDEDVDIMRVPGGWVYIFDLIGAKQNIIFVPWSDEFLKLSNLKPSDTLVS